MRIVCDRYIPFLQEAVISEWPDVEIIPLKPEEIDHSALSGADVLIIRTRTRVHEQLLKGTKVRLVCTATIGYDHIDTSWCDEHDIRWVSCPGCNAQAVCDYVEEVLQEITNHQLQITNTPVIGVIGVGHVGSLVAQMAERKGLRVILNDPPKEIGKSLDFIAKNCDIITFHVPLTSHITHHPSNIKHHTSPITHPTYHLCDETFLSRCKPEALIINAARGGVVDEQALVRSGHPYVLDTWENEPDIDKNVLQRAFLASMHIAGYSWEGKRNASQMCLNAIADAFGLKPIDILLPRYDSLMEEVGDSSPGWISRITEQLKTHPDRFESLRKSYVLR